MLLSSGGKILCHVSQNMQLWEPNVEVRVALLTIAPKKSLAVFASYLCNLGLGQFGGLSAQRRKASSREQCNESAETVPWPFEVLIHQRDAFN